VSESNRRGDPPAPPVTVVGIGADGWDGLPEASRAALRAAGVVLGSPRQLALLPAEVPAQRVSWPSPLRPAVQGLVAAHEAAGLAVLASGDPMLHGIGRTLAEVVGTDRLHVLPHPSSVSLACAALGWALEDVTVVSLVSEPPETLLTRLHPGERLVVLSRGARTPGEVASLLCGNGFGSSAMTVLCSVGGPGAVRMSATAQAWEGPAPDPLNVVAVECVADGSGLRLGLVPGLPDEAFDHDGQITKREVRALTLSLLAPAPGELLWDIGAGSGSVAIEWMRAHPRCRAVAVEADPGRAERVQRNAARLGVPGLQVVTGRAPGALAGLPGPDAVFVGGGLTAPGVFDACWAALRPGARLVVNAVTLESQGELVRLHRLHGGSLTRVDLARAGAVGSFTTWRPALGLVQWAAHKPGPEQGEGPQ
jgi:precorrin-6Y C5,15-methyltransferase (decarboxylating)